jgi:hypothetical protein
VKANMIFFITKVSIFCKILSVQKQSEIMFYFNRI